jgi:hypothetical protein
LEFEAEELKPLGIVFNAYLERHLAAARYRLKDDLVAQASQLAQMSKKQKALEAQAKALVNAQKAIAQKAKAERAREQRLNNEKFARWLDNASWSMRVFCTDSHVLAWAIGITAIVLVPSTAALTIRTVVDEDCFKSPLCGWAVTTFVK